ncbi:MAG: glutamate 5-kinase [Bacillota bacterium]
MEKQEFRRIVVKIGSSTLTHTGGKLNLRHIDHLLRQLVDLKNMDKEVLLVTSGAIGAGMGEMGLKEKPRLIPMQQAAAAVGQGYLIGIYNKLLGEYGEKGAQVLLTASDLEDRTRYLNAFNTLLTLLEYGFIPVVNENDTVVTEEIKFGDNDTLSARVAGMIEADLLINLTSVEGVYNGDPESEDDRTQVIHRIEGYSPELEQYVSSAITRLGTGGMYTKLKAAEIAVNSGITMVIGPGAQENIILKLVDMLEGTPNYSLGTTFLPENDSLSKRKQWLYYNLSPAGSLQIDRGAEKALISGGKSLLPGGVVETSGNFSEGELVKIINSKSEEIGRGLVNYSAADIEEIKGCHSREIYSRLGYINKEEVIHRDNLVIKGVNHEY